MIYRISLVFIFSGILIFFSTSNSEAQASAGKRTFQFAFRPMLTRTWNKDSGFNVGFIESNPAFSFGVQAGAGFRVRPGVRLFLGLGYLRYGSSVKVDNQKLSTQDPSDAEYQFLFGLKSKTYQHFVEIPIRIDFYPNVAEKGLVFGLGVIPSTIFGVSFQVDSKSYGFQQNSEFFTPTELFLGAEIQGGWVFQLSQNWSLDTRLVAFGDPFRPETRPYNRLGLGVQLKLNTGW